MNKAILVCCAMILLICIVAGIGASRIYNNKFDTTDYHKITYHVVKGDTLWELGKEYKQNDDDVRDWVRAVRKLNYMSSAILTAGEVIYIYVANGAN